MKEVGSSDCIMNCIYWEKGDGPFYHSQLERFGTFQTGRHGRLFPARQGPSQPTWKLIRNPNSDNAAVMEKKSDYYKNASKNAPWSPSNYICFLDFSAFTRGICLEKLGFFFFSPDISFEPSVAHARLPLAPQ